MKTIIYYISDYGYGHASRSIAIIRELLKTRLDMNVIICHSFALSFLKESLVHERVSFRKVNTDIGYYLKENSIQPDPVKLEEEFKKYISSFDELVREEFLYFQRVDANLIISDISPIAFEVADKLGIPSVGISNFTWYSAYQDILNPQLLINLEKAYGKMDYFFSLAGSNERNWGRHNNINFGFYSREINLDEVTSLKDKLTKDKSGKYIVYVGLGMKINDLRLDELPLWDNPSCEFIVSSNIELVKPNVHKIPIDYTETQHYIAASDLVITKAGWGTVSEAIVSGTPLLLIERNSMTEDNNTIQYLKKRNLCSTIMWEKLKTVKIEYYLKQTVKRPLDNKNNASEIVGKLLSILNANMIK